MKRAYWGACVALLALAAGAQEIGYIETFSLAADREAALKELVPGTDDFYYFHALHAQNLGDRKRFEETLDRWVRARNGTVTDRARELLNRQALLDYAQDPKRSLDYLRRELGLHFGHSRKTGERAATAPTSFDNALIGVPALLRKALADDPRSLERLEDAGLALAAGAPLSDEQRRNLLARLRRPDYPGVVDLILADLAYRDSRGFGSHAVHRLLTLAQLDELLQKRPALRNESAFVTAYLAKLAPEDEADLDTDAAARAAYYDRIWAFVRTLEPVHNSLKAVTLFNRLRHDQGQGVTDRARFLEYIKLPRDVHYLRPEYRQQVPHAEQFARLNQNYQLVALPPVANEEPLVREILLAFFRDDADYQAFAPYLRDDFLKPLFAEAKIVGGVGDPQQWAPLLAPEAYKRLKERVDIDFAPDNPAVFGADDAVKLTAFVKNVPALLVKVYEINLFNYYRETGQPLNLAVNLDGLVASVTRRAEYKEGAERRMARTFELPELKGRGAYVVELIGNGKSSRALVLKGRLDVLQEVTPAGHAFTVLDEAGVHVTDASGWLGGREFAPDAEGRITVPFSAEAKEEKLVVRRGGFAALVGFSQLSEQYALQARTYVDRESLLRREKALLALRPLLTLRGFPVSVKLLEEPRLEIRSTDLYGIATQREIAGLTLREDAETVQEILVPEGAVSLTVTLKGRVQNISQGKKEELSAAQTFELNGQERTSDVLALYVGRTAAGYYVDARGKNGEPVPGEPLNAFFKHRAFREEVHAVLKTDAQGRAHLGALADVASYRLQASAGAELRGAPTRDACAYPARLHGRAGEVLRVAVPWSAAALDAEASLLETRRGQFVKDWRTALAVADGFLELRGLPAGEYSLALRSAGQEIAVRLTEGAARGGTVVSPRRVLELPRLAPLALVSLAPVQAGVEIRLANVTPFSRVHVFATRYEPEYDLFERLGTVQQPGLSAQPRKPVRALYESGRDIGDEYRYILDRQQAAKYPGNMLERPGLLLNPWSVRSTEAEAERLAEGRAYAGGAPGLTRSVSDRLARRKEAAGPSLGYAALDFLRQPAVALLNLVPDKEGRVVVPREALKGLPFVRALAVDPLGATLRCVALEDSPVATRELRQVAGLDPKRSFAEQKRVTALAPKAAATIGDVTTARFEAVDTVAEAYRLLATLCPDATLEEFAFVAKWPELDAAEQRRLYSKYACHELSFFLYHKDRKFFDTVIAPYLKNKRDKTFLDRWLLGDDLSGYLEPWRYGRLNAAERALLARRLKAGGAPVARDLRETVELLPPDLEAFNRRFDTVLQAGALEAGDEGGVTGAIDGLRKGQAEKQAVSLGVAFMEVADFSSAAGRMAKPAAAPPAPAAAAPAELPAADRFGTADAKEGAKAERRANAVAGKMMEQASPQSGLRQRGLVAADAERKDADADGAAAGEESLYFARQDKSRAAARRFFQKLDQTQEWAENNYWHLPLEEQGPELIAAGAFWSDYAAHDGQGPFLSQAFPETATRFTEMLLALAVLDLPFKAGAHAEKVEGVSYTLTAATPALLFHREVGEAPRGPAGGVLVAQHFFRADDRERVENGERFDKLVTDEFLPGVVYGAQVVMTNPTGSRRKLDALLQIPQGAVPVSNGFYTRGFYVELEPYSTQKQEFFFYFPATGDYPLYPATLADGARVAGGAAPFTFHVVAKLSKVDTASWAWLSQNGTEGEVLAFLETQNLRRVEGELGEIAWRMKDRAFFKQALARLEARRLFDATLWSYGVLHGEPVAIREFLRHHAFADQCGLWLDSPLLALDPVERFDYQHLEYAPLVNPRAHAVGPRRTILNTRFREHYQLFLRVLSYKAKPDAADTLAVAYYLTLQDRVAEALAWFGRVDRKAVPEQLQCDYLEAYLAFYTGELDAARKVARRHAEEGVGRWRDRFVQVLGQLDELAGGPGAAADQEKPSRRWSCWSRRAASASTRATSRRARSASIRWTSSCSSRAAPSCRRARRSSRPSGPP